jgi:phosphatidylserine decarboxylase
MMLQSMTLSIHRDGWRFIAAFACVSLLLAFISTELGWIGVILTGWCVYFFRDPERVTPTRSGLIISPADGIISAIVPASPPEELELSGTNWTRISIFLNIFDVHVNRIPVDGAITKIVYHAGKFFNASLDKASEYNERQSIALKTADQKDIVFVQIAGLIARRILCEVSEGQVVKAGERYGMIRFGSRVDIYLPEGVAPLVIQGQRMIGGETVIADLTSAESQREGAYR